MNRREYLKNAPLLNRSGVLREAGLFLRNVSGPVFAADASAAVSVPADFLAFCRKSEFLIGKFFDYGALSVSAAASARRFRKNSASRAEDSSASSPGSTLG